MRFLIDAQLPPALAAWLRTRGYEAATAREVSLRDASDSAIWKRATEEGYVIVTKDEDFALMAAAEEMGPSVLWVRTGNLVNRLLLARFEHAWGEIEAHLQSGAKVIELR